MSRKKADEAYIQQKISFPATVMARFGRIHWDPVLQRPVYGAVSQVLSAFLTDYVNAVEAGQRPPFELKSERNAQHHDRL